MGLMKGPSTEVWTILTKPTGSVKHPGAGNNRKLLLPLDLKFIEKVLLPQNLRKNIAMRIGLRGTQRLPKLHLSVTGAEEINTSTSLSCLTQISHSSLHMTEVMGKELEIRGQRYLVQS